jgi:hypothetical protein
MATQLIGICGAAGAGKSTVAKHLAETENGKRLRLADGLKRMLKSVGLTDAQVDGNEKNIPLPLLCGKTPRFAMTSLGTGWGRDVIGNDFWMNICAMSLTAELVKGEAKLLIVDDIRYPNELEMIRRLGGQVWLVRRPDVEPQFDLWSRLKRFHGIEKKLHSSELLWRKLPVEQVLFNNGSEDELKRDATGLLQYSRGG